MSFNKDFKNRATLPQSRRKSGSTTGKWVRLPLLIGGLSVIGAVLATSKSGPSDNSYTNAKSTTGVISQDLIIPKLLEQSSIQAREETQDVDWITTTVQSGDSPSAIFSRLNIHSHLHRVLKNDIAKNALSSIKPGQQFKARYDADEKLTELVFIPNKTEEVIIRPEADGYSVMDISHSVDTRSVVANATISDSLYLDGKKAGLSDNVIMQLFNVFAYDIDFALDIRSGDSFSVIYEERYLNGEKLKDGAIKAATFTNKGKTYNAYRYTDKKGNSDYYNEKGHSLKKAFIRTPIKFARISSHFNPKRMHPVLHKIRAHRGVDYAAPIGTPIRATGDGKVTFKGSQRGYGKTIILQHGQRYTTLYAHMNAFNKKVKRGGRVKQGQVIGYVGKTGRATGPHLHYEFRVNNVHKNPVTVKLPNGAPLKKAELPRFKEQIKSMAKLISHERQLLASN